MKRVLIADDEPIERMIVSRTVEKYFSEELTVVSAANGREAVEQFFAGDCLVALRNLKMGNERNDEGTCKNSFSLWYNSKCNRAWNNGNTFG